MAGIPGADKSDVAGFGGAIMIGVPGAGTFVGGAGFDGGGTLLTSMAATNRQLNKRQRVIRPR
jgi:hypothetical protein